MNNARGTRAIIACLDTIFSASSNLMTADMPRVVVVCPKNGFTILKQLIDFASVHPQELKFGSAGIDTTGYLGLERLMNAGAMRFTHVPYKGAAPSAQ